MYKINKKIIIIIFVIVIIVILYNYSIKKNDFSLEYSSTNILDLNKKNDKFENNLLNEENTNEKNNIKDNESKIVVYITGAVRKEGIYEVPENYRIANIIEMAEGTTDNADITNINLAYIVEDGMKIHIPRVGEDINQTKDKTEELISKENNENTNYKSDTSKSNKNDSKNSKININTASQTELENLPGIGPSTALKLIEYRKENGKFKSIEDIKNVKGIGESKFSKIKNLIIV